MALRRHGTLAPFMALAAAIVTLAVGCGGDSSSTAGQGGVPPSSLQQDFAVFRGVRTEADVIPTTLVPRAIARRVGLDMETSRLARSYGGRAIYIVNSPELVCLYSRNYEVGNCWPTSTVERGMATATSICGLGAKANEVVTYGIVPDAVSRVTVLRSNEPDRTAPVIGNVYVGVTGSQPPLPLQLAFEQDGKRVVRPTGIPPNIARKGCATAKSAL